MSCTSSSYRHRTSSSNIVIDGGTYQDKVWDDGLVFKRSTWYNEMAMEYDLLYTVLKANSPFRAWLGEGDKIKVAKCNTLALVLIYTSNNSVEKTPFITQAFAKAGYEEMIFLNFYHELKAHDSYRDWRLESYKLFGFCSSLDRAPVISLDFPGYKMKDVEISE